MKLSDAEWTIMNVVWQHTAVSARKVLEHVRGAPDWAYTTVKTMLDRLVEKGVLQVEKRGNTSLYRARLTRRQARRFALHALLDKAFDGAFGSLLHHLVAEEKLSRKDRQLLEQMLDELERGPENKP